MSHRARRLAVIGVSAGSLLGLTVALVYWPASDSVDSQAVPLASGPVHQLADRESEGVSFAAVVRDRILKLHESSRFENVRSGDGPVGSQECAACHSAIAESHSQTGMGQSLGLMKPETSLPDAVIDDSYSPRQYRVLHRDGVMWHQEWLVVERHGNASVGPQPDAAEVLISEHPVKWQIGSGNHAKSYLLEIDGYLIESPVTWYSARQKWGMSPGFDHPGHSGFSRIAESGCLYCHAGDASPMDGSSYQLSIHEAAIGCERCHGSGKLHVERRNAEQSNLATLDAEASRTEVDTSIVNPRHLDRALSDSICGQCHLRSAATALVPGVRLDDYRPGLNLSDFRTDYRVERSSDPATPAVGPARRTTQGDDSMTVVGHIEQLQKSRCYQNSELSCVTCHDVHRRVLPEERVAHYRSVCWQCHEKQDCHVSAAELQKQSPDNDCTACHMPRSGTDIPHLTFTHHRIGLHSEPDDSQRALAPKPADLPPGTLVPLADSDSIPQPVKDAMLGLAYLEFSGRNDGLPYSQQYQELAFQLLIQAWQQGERSPEIASALAALGTDSSLPGFADFVRAAADRSDITAAMRVNFLLSQAFLNAERNQFGKAAGLLDKVVGIRRASTDWQLLGDFSRAAGQNKRAAEAFEKTLQISPISPGPRRWLIEYYRRTNERDKAELHQRALSLMESWQQQRRNLR